MILFGRGYIKKILRRTFRELDNWVNLTIGSHKQTKKKEKERRRRSRSSSRRRNAGRIKSIE